MPTAIAKPLNSLERSKLRRCERIIEEGCQTFQDVGNALAEIRESKFYRETHKSFRAYCADRWQFTDRRARQLIEGAQIGQQSGTTGSGSSEGGPDTQADQSSPVPATERQARELAKLPEDQQAAAWADAVEEAGGGQPTAAQVREVVDLYLADNEPPETGGGVVGQAEEEVETEEEPKPDPAADWNDTVDAWIKALRQVGRAVKAHPSPWAEECRNIFAAELKTAIGCLQAVKGAGPCAYCKTGCKQCHKTGFLPKDRLEAAPEQ